MGTVVVGVAPDVRAGAIVAIGTVDAGLEVVAPLLFDLIRILPLSVPCLENTVLFFGAIVDTFVLLNYAIIICSGAIVEMPYEVHWFTGTTLRGRIYSMKKHSL